jgi:hypothetical protein
MCDALSGAWDVPAPFKQCLSVSKNYIFFMLLKVSSRFFPGGAVHVGGDNLVYN